MTADNIPSSILSEPVVQRIIEERLQRVTA